MGLFSDVLSFGFKATCFTAKVGTIAAVNTVSGAVKTVGAAAGVVNDLCNGDLEAADKKVEERVAATFNGLCNSVKAGCTLLENASDAAENNSNFFNSKNAKLAAAVLCGAGAVGLTSSMLLGDDASDISLEDGKFDGDNDELNELALMGENDDAEHVPSDEVERSLAARNEFLHIHGYDSVPEGYEVHHIVPLSEGGTDTPDNMVLLSKDDHDYITALHASFYGWHGRNS